jgi:hypothetical protein
MRRTLILVLLAVGLGLSPCAYAQGAGQTLTKVQVATGEISYMLAFNWTASTAGAATSTLSTSSTFALQPCNCLPYNLLGLYLQSVQVIPGPGANQPTNGYGVMIEDWNSTPTDLLSGNGLNQSSTIPGYVTPNTTSRMIMGNLTLNITGAGANSTGTVILYISTQAAPGQVNLGSINVNLGSVNINTTNLAQEAGGNLALLAGTVVSQHVQVVGNFYQATQPVSLAALPALVGSTANIGNVGLNVNGSAVTSGNPIPVTGSFAANVTFPYTGLSSGQAAQMSSFIGVGGIYNASLPSLNNGQYSPLQVDGNGNLRVAGAFSANTVFPYGASSGQTATANSVVGLAAWNGSTVDALKSTGNALWSNVTNWPTTQNVAQIGNGTLVSGQASVTATAAALASNSAKGVCVNALAANTIPVYVGPSGTTTSTGFQLVPGAGICFAVSNSNLVYVVASTTGASVSWALTN